LKALKLVRKMKKAKKEVRNTCSLGLPFLTKSSRTEGEIRVKVQTEAINSPLIRIDDHMLGVMMLSSRLIGASCIVVFKAGSPPKAMAARVSMTKFTQRSWIKVNGKSNPKNGPTNTIRREAQFTVDWKTINFLIDLKIVRP